MISIFFHCSNAHLSATTMASLSPRVSGETRETLSTTLIAPSETARHPRKAFSVSYLFNKARLVNRSGSFRFSMLHPHFNLNPASNALRRHCGASA
jgi:hypothetical protein